LFSAARVGGLRSQIDFVGATIAIDAALISSAAGLTGASILNIHFVSRVWRKTIATEVVIGAAVSSVVIDASAVCAGVPAFAATAVTDATPRGFPITGLARGKAKAESSFIDPS